MGYSLHIAGALALVHGFQAAAATTHRENAGSVDENDCN